MSDDAAEGKQHTSVEHVGRSQVIPGVRPT
jgi:hypothetical protein